MFLFALLAAGLFIYKDFGISWDGPAQRVIGGSNLRYICEQTPLCTPDEFLRSFETLPKLVNRDYSPIHEVLLMTAEWQLGITDPQKIYELRSLLNFLLFFIGTVAFFFFAKDVLRSAKYGLFAVMILVLSPRIFGHAFFNTKDLAFLSSILIALFTMNRMLRKPNLNNALWHGLATGFAIDVRIMGVVILASTLLASVISAIKDPKRAKKHLSMSGVYLVAALCATVAMWPHLWHRPAVNFAEAFANMAHFRWTAPVKFAGELIRADLLPWYYAPTWIAISTPLMYLTLIVAGIWFTIRNLCINHIRLWRDHEGMVTLICAALFLVPLAAVILLKSILYDGWRQLFFIYPAAVLLAAYAIKRLDKRLRPNDKLWTFGAVVLCAGLGLNFYRIVAIHPFQNSYLNILAGSNPSFRFDNDYWGISNKQAIAYIARSDSAPSITIAGRKSGPIDNAIRSLPHDVRHRFRESKPESKPDYIITNYRIDLDSSHSWYGGYQIVHQIDVMGDKITTVFKRN